MSYRIPSGYRPAHYAPPVGYGPAPSMGTQYVATGDVIHANAVAGNQLEIGPPEAPLLTLTLVEGAPADPATEVQIDGSVDSDITLAAAIRAAINHEDNAALGITASAQAETIVVRNIAPGATPVMALVWTGNWIENLGGSAGNDPWPGKLPLCIGKLRGVAEYIIPFDPPPVS